MWRPVKNKEFTPFSIYFKQGYNKRVGEKRITGRSIIESGAVGKKKKEKILIQEVKAKLGDHGI